MPTLLLQTRNSLDEPWATIGAPRSYATELGYLDAFTTLESERCRWERNHPDFATATFRIVESTD